MDVTTPSQLASRSHPVRPKASPARSGRVLPSAAPGEGAAMASAVVVYESVFGDAETIARAVADGLREHLDTEVVAARDAPDELAPDVRLLVVGGPNHALGMPRPATREGAVKQHGAEIADTTTGLREWLEAVTVPGHISAA